MYSKLKLPLFFFLLAALSGLTACEKFLGKEQQKSDIIVMTPKELECLKVWPEKVKSYVDDKASVEQTNEIFSCLSGAMTTFAKFTQGQNADSYTPAELVHYLNRYMLKEYQIQESFMAELMKIKVFMIGGSANSITRSEIDVIKTDLEMLREEAQKLRGKMRILTFTADPMHVTEKRITDTQELVRATLDRLLQNSKVAGSLYEWSDFKSLISELNSFLKDSQTTQLIQKWYPLGNALRKVFIGDHSDIRTLSDYKMTASWIVDSFGLVARYYYLIHGRELDEKQVWNQSMKLAESGYEVIEKSPAMQKGGLLTAEAIDETIYELDQAKFLTKDLNAEVLKNAYRNLIAHVIQGGRYGRIEGQVVKGIDKLDLNFIRFEYRVWKTAQMAILKEFEQKGNIYLADFLGHMQKTNTSELFQKLGIERDQHVGLARTWNDWIQLLSLKKPLLWNEHNKVQIPTDAAQNSRNAITLASASSLNLLRTFSRLILLAYGQSKNQVKTQVTAWDLFLTEEQMIQFEFDFRELGQALKLLDPRTTDAAKRTFLEGNYFPFSTNGDGKLTGVELTEQFSILFSAGRNTSDAIMNEALGEKCSTNRKGEFDKDILDEKCFLKIYRDNFARYYDNLSALSNQVSKGILKFDRLYSFLMEISRIEGKGRGTIEYSEIRTMSVVLHYVEALMSVYDRDSNGILSEAELRAAFPRFRMIVDKMNPLGRILPSETAFLYIVVRGNIPDTSSFVGEIGAAADLTRFMLFEDINSKRINREHLLKVISLIKSVAAKNQPN